MKVEVIMPQMGESIQEGTVVKWLKKPGEKVKRDEPILEISTDKVDAEIPSPAAGVLSEIKIGEGKTVEIKTVLGTIDTEGQAGAAASGPAETGSSASAGPASDSGGPTPGEDAEKRAAKPAAASPRSPEPARPVASAAPKPSALPGTLEERIRTRSSPLVRRMAKEANVDIATLQGSGISGRVTKNDFLSHVQGAGPRATASSPAPASAPAIAFKPGERTKVEPLAVMRRKISEHMVASKRTSAHVHSFFEVDYTAVDRIRREKKEAFL